MLRIEIGEGAGQSRSIFLYSVGMDHELWCELR
jgi:hypothetical protein